MTESCLHPPEQTQTEKRERQIEGSQTGGGKRRVSRIKWHLFVEVSKTAQEPTKRSNSPQRLQFTVLWKGVSGEGGKQGPRPPDATALSCKASFCGRECGTDTKNRQDSAGRSLCRRLSWTAGQSRHLPGHLVSLLPTAPARHG